MIKRYDLLVLITSQRNLFGMSAEMMMWGHLSVWRTCGLPSLNMITLQLGRCRVIKGYHHCWMEHTHLVRWSGFGWWFDDLRGSYGKPTRSLQLDIANGYRLRASVATSVRPPKRPVGWEHSDGPPDGGKTAFGESFPTTVGYQPVLHRLGVSTSIVTYYHQPSRTMSVISINHDH